MANYFDEFSKVIGEGSMPRRETLRRLGLVISGALLGPLGIEYARASHKPKPPKQVDRCKAFCKCSHGRQQDQCVKACKDCNKDPSRLAGACGNYYCCGAGMTSCGEYCADVASDTDNCGACRNVCPAPGTSEYVVCVAGQCEYACNYGATDCAGACRYLDSDPDNCGACGNACGDATPNCVYGVCSECDFGQANCGSGCTDILYDPSNCGACANTCGSSQYCYYGYCYDYYYGGGGGGYGGYGGYGWWWY
jgi:hypothetical protein